jgi:phage N-6-adenine-methyltransferase
VRGESVLFSKDSNLWQTPDDLFNALNREFHFTLDVAASKENAKVKMFISAEQDALKSEWSGVCWCNPPYNLTKEFLIRAGTMACLGVTSVLLIPARTDTKYWHEWVSQADEVRFLKGRVKFIGARHGQALNSAPFPSAVVVFRPLTMGTYKRATNYWTWDYRVKGDK